MTSLTDIETAPPETAPPETALARAYATIRTGILDGRFRPGDRLREEHLAETAGVSRTPVREALRRLATEGLVELTPGLGAFVSSWSVADLEAIFAVRALVEAAVAEQAARHLAAADIDALEALAERMEDLAARRPAGFLDRITGLNHEFHTRIAAACGNDRLAGLLTQTVDLILVHRTFRRYHDRQLVRSMAHHRELVDAFRARDADWAGAVMRAHVHAARHALVADLSLSPPAEPKAP